MSEPHPDFSALDLDDPVVTSLLFKQAVTMEQVDRAWRCVRDRNENALPGTLWRALAEDPSVNRERVFAEAAAVSGCARIDVDVDAARAAIGRLVGSIPERDWQMLVDLQVVPVGRDAAQTDDPDQVILASHDPSRPEVARLLRRLHLSDCEVRYAPQSDLEDLIHYAVAALDSDGRDEASDGRVDMMLEEFLALAVRESATAIHVRSGETGIRIGLRIDGALVPWVEQPDVAVEEILSTFKTAVGRPVFASAPAVTYRRIDGRRIRFSLSVLPIEGGDGYESVVVRIDEEPISDLSDLGLPRSVSDNVRDVLHRGGMIVVTSPVGSGCTATASALARDLASAQAVVASLEGAGANDDILSIRLDRSVELPDALATISEHDVDAVLVPPPADRREAEAALSVALNGRVVITRLNESSVRGVVDAFTRLGVDPAVSTQAIELVVAQRRLRTLCADCKVPSAHVEVDYLQYLGFTKAEAEGGTFYDVARRDQNGDACATCGGSGYSGTMLLVEVTRMRPDARRKISLGADEPDVYETSGSIAAQARALATSGTSTLRELVRVSGFSPYSASPPRSR
ncbi:MAG: ATPase, T2SS/T4P/T4SS family [Rhodothermales bacterium]